MPDSSRQTDTAANCGCTQEGTSRPGPLTSYIKERHARTTDPPESANDTSRIENHRAANGRPESNRSTQRRAYSARSRSVKPAQHRKGPRKPQRGTRQQPCSPPRDVATPHPDTPTGLRCIRCGNLVTFSNEDRCENCFAEDAIRWHGNHQLVTFQW